MGNTTIRNEETSAQRAINDANVTKDIRSTPVPAGLSVTVKYGFDFGVIEWPPTTRVGGGGHSVPVTQRFPVSCRAVDGADEKFNAVVLKWIAPSIADPGVSPNGSVR